ncbi:hypothetical protein IAT40_003045 [Kwoniella sp. CBS 6097]
MLPPQRPDSDYQRWKRSRLLPQHGPKNSVIWSTDGNSGELGESMARPTRVNTADTSPSTALDILRHGSPTSSPISARSGAATIHIADRLTTLPLPGDRNPLAVLAEASADVAGQDGQTSMAANTSQSSQGRQEESYYEPVERILKDEAPHIMALISVPEAERLFDMYFSHLHPHLPLLDVPHSPPSAVARRNNFLFNAICCASARAFDPTLWSRLADFAKFEMERLPKEKNIDVIQGHCIHAMWNMNPPKHFELDMSWLRTGLAIRTAVDINLHRVVLVPEARDGLPEWVIRAIARTWLGAYIVDQTMSIQLGKASSMRGEQSVRLYINLLRSSRDAQQASTPSLSDLWIAALAEWTQLLTRAVDSLHSKSDNDALDRPCGNYPGGLASEMGLPDLARIYDQQFKSWRQRVEAEVREADRNSTGVRLPNEEEASGAQAVSNNIQIYQQYATLLIHSFSLERSGGINEGPLTGALIEIQTMSVGVIRTYQAYFDSVTCHRKGSPDILHSFLTYAAVSLLRILQPQYSFMDPDYRSVLHTARTAAIMLARAPSPLAKSNSDFLNRLIDTKALQLVSRAAPAKPIRNSSWETAPDDSHAPAIQRQREATATSSHVSDPDRSLNLEAFGHLLNRDQGRSVWPPLPDSAWDPPLFLSDQSSSLANTDAQAALPVQLTTSRHEFDPLDLLLSQRALAAHHGHPLQTEIDASDASRADNEHSVPEPKDLHSWVNRLTEGQDSVYVPAAAIGTGLQHDLLFTQDNFWRSILEGLPAHSTT